MGLIAVILLMGILASIYEVPSLLKKKQKIEVIVYFSFLAFGVIWSILIGMDLHIPTPLSIITFIFKPASDLLESWLT